MEEQDIWSHHMLAVRKMRQVLGGELDHMVEDVEKNGIEPCIDACCCVEIDPG